MMRRSILLILALCLLAGPALATTPPEVEAELGVITRLSAEGKYPEALEHLKAAIKARPEQVPFHLAYIELMIRVNQREDAQRVYKDLVDKSPEKATVQFLYGKTLTDPKDRKARYEKALSLEPTNPWAHLGMASVAVTSQDLEGAITELKAALEVAPTLEPALEMLGTLYGAQGRIPEAIAAYERLEQADTTSGRASDALGRLYALAGRPADAVAAYERAAKLQPDNPSVYANLGYLYFEANRYADAYGAYARVLELEPTDETSRIMMDVSEKVRDGRLSHAVVTAVSKAQEDEERDPLAALEAYGRAVAEAPDFALAQLGYGRMLIAAGDLQRGAEAITQAMALAPDYYQVRMAYARLMLELNRPAEAEKHLKRATELQPGDAEPYLALAVVFTTQRRPRAAEVAYRNAIPLLEGESAMAAWINLAGAIAAQGRVDEAARELEEIRKVIPENAEVTLSLARLRLEAERFDDAARLAGEVLKADPHSDPAKDLLDSVDRARIQYDEDMKTKQRASQILVADEAKARELLKELKAGADFAALARANSTGSEAVDGGDLGFFSPEELAPQLSQALAQVPVGGLTGVVKTDAGYHILKRTH